MEKFIIATLILCAVIFAGSSFIRSLKHKKKNDCCSEKKCDGKGCDTNIFKK